MYATEPLKHVAGQKHDNHTKDLKTETKCDCGYFSDSTEELCHQRDRKEEMIELNNEEKVVIESGEEKRMKGEGDKTDNEEEAETGVLACNDDSNIGNESDSDPAG